MIRFCVFFFFADYSVHFIHLKVMDSPRLAVLEAHKPPCSKFKKIGVVIEVDFFAKWHCTRNILITTDT